MISKSSCCHVPIAWTGPGVNCRLDPIIAVDVRPLTGKINFMSICCMDWERSWRLPTPLSIPSCVMGLSPAVPLLAPPRPPSPLPFHHFPAATPPSILRLPPPSALTPSPPRSHSPSHIPSAPSPSSHSHHRGAAPSPSLLLESRRNARLCHSSCRSLLAQSAFLPLCQLTASHLLSRRCLALTATHCSRAIAIIIAVATIIAVAIPLSSPSPSLRFVQGAPLPCPYPLRPCLLPPPLSAIYIVSLLLPPRPTLILAPSPPQRPPFPSPSPARGKPPFFTCSAHAFALSIPFCCSLVRGTILGAITLSLKRLIPTTHSYFSSHV